eukprot:1448062-Amphidinium_carterae.1
MIHSALAIFTDASFSPRGNKSQSRLVLIHDGGVASCKTIGNIITWRSNRQSIVAKSTAGSELIASFTILLSEITAKPSQVELGLDNTAALSMIQKVDASAFRTRFISIRAHWLANSGIATRYVATDLQDADALTKGSGANMSSKIKASLRLTGVVADVETGVVDAEPLKSTKCVFRLLCDHEA